MNPIKINRPEGIKAISWIRINKPNSVSAVFMAILDLIKIGSSCICTQQQIASECGCSLTTVKRAMNELRCLQYIMWRKVCTGLLITINGRIAYVPKGNKRERIGECDIWNVNILIKK